MEKVPVQDSEPPDLSKRTLVPNTVQPPLTGMDVPDMPEPGPARCRDDEDEVCFSKPGVLLSVQPGTTQHSTLRAIGAGPAEPSFSGNNISLQISEPEQEGSGARPHGPEGSLEAPPQGNHCVPDALASFAEREAQEVLEHIGHVMGEPSIQNLAGNAQGILGNEVQASQEGQWDEKSQKCQPEIVVQSPSPSSPSPPPPPPAECGDDGGEAHPQILNGKPAAALAHEQAPKQEPSQSTVGFVVSLVPRTNYIMTAVGMAACAVFVAWKRKN